MIFKDFHFDSLKEGALLLCARSRCSYAMDDSLVTAIVLPHVPPTATASRLDWCARNTAVNRLALVCSLWRGALHPAADLSAAPVQSTPDSLQRCISLNHPSDIGPELWAVEQEVCGLDRQPAPSVSRSLPRIARASGACSRPCTAASRDFWQVRQSSLKVWWVTVPCQL